MNDFYDAARRRFLSGLLNWPTLTVRLAAFDRTDYVFDSTQLKLSDIGVPAAFSIPLTGLAVSAGGYARGSDAIFATPPVGPAWTFFVLTDATGVPDPDAKLICFYDEGIGLPYTPNGQDETISPDWSRERGWLRP